MAWHVFAGGAWEQVHSPRVVVGGEYKDVQRAYVFSGGQWLRYWPEQEPTVTTIDGGLASPTIGVSATVFGAVTTEVGVITGGVVRLYQRLVGEDDGAWVEVGATAVFNPGAPVGNWSMTATPAKCGQSEFKAVYEGTATNAASEAVQTPVSVSIGFPAKPSGGTITNTSLAISWPAVPGADLYVLRRDGVAVDAVDGATTSYTFTGLSAGTDYTLTVAASSGSCEAESPEKIGRTSADEVRDTGSATVQVESAKSGSYRPDVGWGYIAAKVGQGYYSDSGRNYTGVIDYGGASVMRGKIVTALGANGDKRFDNGSITGARVYLYKVSGVGSGGAVTASFFNSTAECDVGGAPARTGTKVDVATTSSGAGKWYDIGTAHGTAVARGTGSARSIVLYNATSANYLQMQARSFSADSCDMQLDFTWDYVLQPAVTGSWLN